MKTHTKIDLKTIGPETVTDYRLDIQERWLIVVTLQMVWKQELSQQIKGGGVWLQFESQSIFEEFASAQQ